LHTPQPARLRLLLVGGVSFGVQVGERVGLIDLGRLYLDVHFLDLNVHFV